VKIKVLRGHKDAVNSCSFTFDDSKIVTASHDKTLRLWVGRFHSLDICFGSSWDLEVLLPYHGQKRDGITTIIKKWIIE